MTVEPKVQRHHESRMSEASGTTTDAVTALGAASANQCHSTARILLVDDDAKVRESLGAVLSQEHYTVKLAGDGREAVRQLLDGPPDLLLLDVSMPDITGWQTAKILAQLHPQVPVIIITARTGQARRAAELGANALLEKPIEITLLLHTVRELLAHPDSTHFDETRRVWHTKDLLGSQG